jgi:hypothetical protein
MLIALAKPRSNLLGYSTLATKSDSQNVINSHIQHLKINLSAY